MSSRNDNGKTTVRFDETAGFREPRRTNWLSNRGQRDHYVEEGLNLGITDIATAEMYLAGTPGRWIAEAIAGATSSSWSPKCYLKTLRLAAIAACERSLARLRTDRLDCYLLHWRGRHPLAEIIAPFEKLRASGKMLSLGRQQFRCRRSAGSARSRRCRQCGLQSRAVSPSPACHRVCGDGLVSRERRRPVGLTVPLGATSFSARHTAGDRVQKIAAAHDATLRQVALCFLLRFPTSS
jgi:diketogulonate reductase-like aldo/keto reductase